MTDDIRFTYNDGGRGAAGFIGRASDCVTRAIAIAAELPYQQVYDDLFERAKGYAATSRSRTAKAMRAGRAGGTSPRNGVHNQIWKPYLADLGWAWTPTMGIGTGCTVHLHPDELPPGRLIVSVSKHLVAVIDGVIHDTHDPSRDGTRCVYGYHRKDA